MEEDRQRTAPARKRADFGAPIDGFFEKQPSVLRAILDELRTLVIEAAPDAQSSIKWGNPFFSVDGAMICALTAHKAHVNLVLAGPPSAFADPEHRLTGESDSGRHLKLTDVSQIPRESVLDRVRTAAELATEKLSLAEPRRPGRRRRSKRPGSAPSGSLQRRGPSLRRSRSHMPGTRSLRRRGAGWKG